LNPHKCVFCVQSSRLLIFVVSKEGICVDPLKVEVILKFSPPSKLRQLQSLQGKENFLCQFIPNYVELTKGLTPLLKKGISFTRDEVTKKYFDAPKHMLTHTPLLHLNDYHRDYFLYLAASDITIGMVLV